jgi:hypothetical protein
MKSLFNYFLSFLIMVRLRITGSTGLFGPYNDFSYSTRQEIVNQIYEAYDDVFEEWLAGKYDPRQTLKEAMYYDDKATDLRDVHWTLWNYYPTDRVHYNEYWCPGPEDWLKYNTHMTEWRKYMTHMTQWPTCDDRRFLVARPFSMHGPSGEVERVNYLTPVVCPIPVALPVGGVDSDSEITVEHVPRRSTRAKKQRQFYYGY